jgi:hypothetical protein
MAFAICICLVVNVGGLMEPPLYSCNVFIKFIELLDVWTVTAARKKSKHQIFQVADTIILQACALIKLEHKFSGINKFFILHHTQILAELSEPMLVHVNVDFCRLNFEVLQNFCSPCIISYRIWLL